MYSLGLICYQGHSSSVALMKNGQLLLAVSEERFSRVKHDDSFPIKSIEFILEQEKIDINDIAQIAIAWSIKKTILGQLKKINFDSFNFAFEVRAGGQRRSRVSKFLKIFNLKKEIKERLGYRGRIHYLDHHLCHAAVAFWNSGFKDSIVFVADGMGESSSTSIYLANDNQFKKIYNDEFPHSLGVFYSAGTQYLNFEPDSDEFKVMGLAAYGEASKYVSLIEKLYFFEEGHFRLNLKYFNIHKKGNEFISEDYKELFGRKTTIKEKKDFAYALQLHLEKIIFQIIEQNQLYKLSPNFCSAGGVFLNCLANQKLREKKFFKGNYFFPVSDDNGTCIGAAMLMQVKHFTLEKIQDLYLGPTIKCNTNIIANLNFKKVSNQSEIAQLISEQKVVGIARHKMEFGHRALGDRSIVADPRNPMMKDIINEKIKYREEYRPFAPSVLKEFAADYFYLDEKADYRFMIETVTAKDLCREKAPAIVHADNTARIQIVDKDSNPEYWDLIHCFYLLTGVPMILNTSLNLNGMPIVLEQEDAIKCLVNSDLDYLIIEDVLIWK